MSAYKAILSVGGTEYRLLKFSYTLNQPIEEKTNRPTSSVIGGTIECWVKSTGDSTFWEWMCDPTMRKDGSIDLFKMHEDSSLRKLEFSKAYCVEFTESFNFTGEDGPTIQHFKLAARTMKIGETDHNNEWEA
jgi:hypothetical protein